MAAAAPTLHKSFALRGSAANADVAAIATNAKQMAAFNLTAEYRLRYPIRQHDWTIS
jgi:ABC-type uncharacterized transport system YnjBCD substrate-binding protein